MRAVASRLVAPIAVLIAAVAGCTEVGTNPTIVTAISFDTLPFPAVVTGDSLRDSLGVVAPMRAVAFNSTGGIVPNPGLQYIALDSGLTIDAAGHVTAQLRTGTVRIVASAPGLQSIVQHLIVARRPDSVVVTAPALDTLFYVLPDNPSSNVSPALTLQVATRDTAGGVLGAQGWEVSWRVLFRGAALAKSDTTIASLWSSAGTNPQLLDTTDASGSASMRLRVRPAGLPTAAESLTVIATIRYHGAPVAGSPVTYVVQVRPK